MRNKSKRVKVNVLFVFLFFSAFVIAIAKLFYVAVSNDVDGINLTTFANNRNTVKKTLYAARGNIYDVNGEIIAQNVNSYTLIAYLSESRTTNPKEPQHVVDKEGTAKALAEILDLEYDYILGRLNTKNAYQVEFGIGGKNLSENKKVAIEALALPGIDFIEGSKRYYKKSKMASYIVGYAKTSEDGEFVGEMGVEGYYNNVLKGTNGESIYQVSAVGYQMGEAYTTESVSGSDIYLTLDTQIQLILEDAVHTLEENNEFTWFTISVMNAKTGAIVGSATSPNFNPNTLEGLTNYVNPLVGYTYEPGSTMKIFSWLAAMEKGLYDGEEEFMSGSIKVNGATIKDFNNSGWGKISYDTGFAYSSNVGATNLALRLGSAKLRDFYESLGFGMKTGIELPGEEKGIIRFTYESELASASFGQGITTTPIQTLQALSVLTNDGVMLKPYIVDKIVDQAGNVTYESKRTELGKKVSSESIKKINELMYDVVYNGLTG
ncbi:MAG: penicillin-binding protein 2, partial [Bacilli bacterium]|nr:penicillin-binding protein 2 [Bacilli bacterium]